MAANPARPAIAPLVPKLSSDTADCDLGGERQLENVKLTNGLVPMSFRHDMVSEAAYFRAERRGFLGGHEIEDWLAAEEEVDELIARRYGY
jgi:hypothetical protein